jgi:hypothetical protein
MIVVDTGVPLAVADEDDRWLNRSGFPEIVDR